MGAIILAIILACASLTVGGALGSADLKAKIEGGQVQVHTEQETRVVVSDDGGGR